MAYADETSALILLVSADRYSALRQWLLNLSFDQSDHQSIELIDLTSEWTINGENVPIGTDFVVYHFNHAKTVETIWNTLNPHAKEWWDLLDISTKQSIELPTLPGIEDLTRLIYLSEKIENAGQDHHMIIVLPQPIHAAKLLKMAQQGPDMIDQLLEPLLNWWDSTRQTLATVEKILRLKLPSSQQLRLNFTWKSRLLRLQEIIKNRNYHYLSFLLDAEDCSQLQVLNRLGVFSMCGTIPHAVCLAGLETTIADEIETTFKDSPMVASKSITPPRMSTAAEKVNGSKSLETMQWDNEKKSMEIFLPGVDKEELLIQQVDQIIHFVYRGHLRAVVLPEDFVAATCERAQISSGWLTLSFGSH